MEMICLRDQWILASEELTHACSRDLDYGSHCSPCVRAQDAPRGLSPFSTFAWTQRGVIKNGWVIRTHKCTCRSCWSLTSLGLV